MVMRPMDTPSDTMVGIIDIITMTGTDSSVLRNPKMYRGGIQNHAPS